MMLLVVPVLLLVAADDGHDVMDFSWGHARAMHVRNVVVCLWGQPLTRSGETRKLL